MGILIENVLTVTMNQKGDIGVYSILIEEDRIVYVGKEIPDSKGNHKIISGEGKIAIPGLINSHIHSDVTLARGLGDGLTLYQQDFDSFVSRKKWFKNELDHKARYYSRLLQYCESLKGGTTFICDVPFWSYGDDLVLPLKESGIKGAVVLDYRCDFLTGELIDKKSYFEMADRLKKNGYLPVVGGPAEEHFEVNLLKKLMKWAEELETFLQLHLAETTWRREIVKKSFNCTSVELLHHAGVLNNRLIGSHGVYLEKSDIDLIRENSTKIVNCPVAEMKISDGIAPIKELIENSVPVGIGTDGALWNDSADLFSEMKTLLLLQRVSKGVSAIDPYSCLYAATLGGAKVFGLEKEIGSIEAGKKASIVLIDYKKPHIVPLYHRNFSNLIQNIVSCIRASDVDTVIVEGDVLVERGRIIKLNEDELVQTCQRLGESRFGNMDD